MEKKFKVTEFAGLVGCTPKTVYKMIERGELITVNELVKNREITFIVANDANIANLQKVFGKNSKITVNEGEYEDILTDNVSNYTYNEPQNQESGQFYNVDIMEVTNRIVTLSESYSAQLMKYNEELITARSKVLLLEDSEKRKEEEALRVKAEVKTLTLQNKNLRYISIGLATLLVIICSVFLTLFFINHNEAEIKNSAETANPVQTADTAQVKNNSAAPAAPNNISKPKQRLKK